MQGADEDHRHRRHVDHEALGDDRGERPHRVVVDAQLRDDAIELRPQALQSRDRHVLALVARAEEVQQGDPANERRHHRHEDEEVRAYHRHLDRHVERRGEAEGHHREQSQHAVEEHRAEDGEPVVRHRLHEEVCAHRVAGDAARQERRIENAGAVEEEALPEPGADALVREHVAHAYGAERRLHDHQHDAGGHHVRRERQRERRIEPPRHHHPGDERDADDVLEEKPRDLAHAAAQTAHAGRREVLFVVDVLHGAGSGCGRHQWRPKRPASDRTIASAACPEP